MLLSDFGQLRDGTGQFGKVAVGFPDRIWREFRRWEFESIPRAGIQSMAAADGTVTCRVWRSWINSDREELPQDSAQAPHQPIANLTGLPTRLSISTSVSMVSFAVFLFTTSDTRGRVT